MRGEKRVLTSQRNKISGFVSESKHPRERIALGFTSHWQFQARIFIGLFIRPLWVIEIQRGFSVRGRILVDFSYESLHWFFLNLQRNGAPFTDLLIQWILFLVICIVSVVMISSTCYSMESHGLIKKRKVVRNLDGERVVSIVLVVRREVEKFRNVNLLFLVRGEGLIFPICKASVKIGFELGFRILIWELGI